MMPSTAGWSTVQGSSLAAQELEVYRELWTGPKSYTKSEHVVTPGIRYQPLLLDLVGDERGTVLDVGCGDGSSGLAYRDLGFTVTLSDLSNEWLVPEARALPFVPHAIWQPFPQTAKLGGKYDVVTCTDVLEHLDEALTLLSIARLLEVGRHVFLSIALVPDTWGVWVGRSLHQTVKPFTWWRDRLREVGRVQDARDLMMIGIYWVAPR